MTTTASLAHLTPQRIRTPTVRWIRGWTVPGQPASGTPPTPAPGQKKDHGSSVRMITAPLYRKIRRFLQPDDSEGCPDPHPTVGQPDLDGSDRGAGGRAEEAHPDNPLHQP